MPHPARMARRGRNSKARPSELHAAKGRVRSMLQRREWIFINGKRYLKWVEGASGYGFATKRETSAGALGTDRREKLRVEIIPP